MLPLWQIIQELGYGGGLIICIAAVNLSGSHEDWAEPLGVEIARTTVITVNAFLGILFI
jgi:hypothetical protein